MFRLALTVGLVVAVLVAPVQANFIEDWSLGVLIAPGNADPQNDRFRDPISPFMESHTIELLGSIASASYDFEWNALSGDFDIASNLQVAAIPGANRRVTSAGLFYINSPVPLLISGTSEFDYNLPRDSMFTIVDLGISTEDGIGVIVVDYDLYSTTTGGPHAGTVTAGSSDILFPANETFVMQYSFLIDADSGVSGSALASGIGNAHFEVTAIPEPTTVWLLASPVLMFAAHRTRRSG
ncbi:MAG: hypothetical protein H6818_02890 [Phycisphaerales bacterium]|nr:hypothetical protein [Phycisphaerales bacterium]MCB9864673.1 hypothetical protein [Phycisphaerales bacterium]